VSPAAGVTDSALRHQSNESEQMELEELSEPVWQPAAVPPCHDPEDAAPDWVDAYEC